MAPRGVPSVKETELKAGWYQKWLVHRRLRPEAFGGRVQNQITHVAEYPLPADVLNAQAPGEVFRATGSYLLPMAYPEGVRREAKGETAKG